MQNLKMSLSAILVLSLAACGRSGQFPTLEYAMPSSLSASSATVSAASSSSVSSRTSIEEEALVASQAVFAPGEGILMHQTQRVDRIIKDANRILDRLNKDSVNGIGSFSGKGPNKNISGKISSLADSETYEFEAVVCADDVPFQLVRWNADKTKVELIRDFGVHPLGDLLGISLVSQVLYDASGDVTSLKVFAHGARPHLPDDAAEEAVLSEITEYMEGTRSAEGNHTIKSVAFFDDGETSSFSAGQGMGYLVGRLNNDNSGEFALYGKNIPSDCSTAPSSSNESDPAAFLCRAGNLGSTHLRGTEAGQFFTDHLADLGIASSSNLKIVAMPEGLSCN